MKPEAPVLATPLPRARILMVDDHAPNLVALDAILSPLDQDLVRASSGEGALRELLSGEFAVILMDVQMPGIDGIETAALIKQRDRNRHIPIIFLTAIHRDPSTIFRGYARGAVDYMVKPFDPEILRTKVSVFVDLWRNGEQVKRQAALLRQRDRIELERRSEVRYRALTDSMPGCVWATWADGQVYYSNQRWRDYAGIDERDRQGFLEAVPTDDLARVGAAWAEALRSATPLELELRLRRKGGDELWHMLRAVPERDEQGRLTGWVAIATEIDARKRLEEAHQVLLVREQQARAQAEVANRSKDEFLATVSHELRTPLTAILGWTRMLRTGAVPAAGQPRALETIERNARAQTQLIEDILDVSRIITGKLHMDVQPIELTAVIRAAFDTVKLAADNKGVALTASLDEDASGCSGDPDRLQQVVWNLLTNAVKFTGAGGEVSVKLRRSVPTGQIEIVVQDSGSGISGEFLPHVFDRFRQADTSITRAQGGLGLGLAIVRHLVEMHGGSVRAESEGEGKGATFTVRLPVESLAGEPAEVADASLGAANPASPSNELSLEELPAASLPRPQRREQANLRGVRVLVVDDDPDARDLLAAVLETSGAEAFCAASVDEALLLLIEERPDVLVSDIGLPRQDGFALIRRVRALRPDQGGLVPAAALTAYTTADDSRRAILAGFQLHVAKPIEPDVLTRVVSQLAGKNGSAPPDVGPERSRALP